MKLSRVRLMNFRCYQEETAFDIGNLTLFIGCNDCGKSAVFDALSIFFDETKLDTDDASTKGEKDNVRIICEFEDLPEEIIVDADYSTNLKDEYLLNENGRLEIHKVYNGSLKTPKETGIFAHAMHPGADRRNDLLTITNSELKERANELSINTQEIDVRKNALIRKLIWESTSVLELQLTEIPLDEASAGKIWDQLKKSLPTFALFKSDRPSTDQDSEAQDPMKAAIQEAIKGQQERLDEISENVKKEVETVARETVSKIREMDPTLASQLNPRFLPPKWDAIFKVSLTGDDDIPINKRGSGIRRLILLNFFRAKAERSSSEKGSTDIIYAIEEPETSQHPNNQKMLMKALYELSANPDCQVMLTTHTPTLVRIVPDECLRYIIVCEDGRREIYFGSDETRKLIAEDLGILPDHDVKLFIGVEGINDENFLFGISKILKEHGEDVPDLEKLKDDGKIIIIPCGGTNLVHWTSRLADLNRPEFYLFDRGSEPSEPAEYQEIVDKMNKQVGCEAYLTNKREMENYLHPDTIMAIEPDISVTFGDFDNVPALVAQAVHNNSDSDKKWDELSNEKKGKKISRVKQRLNTEAVKAMTPALLDEQDPDGDVKGWLLKISSLLDTGN